MKKTTFTLVIIVIAISIVIIVSLKIKYHPPRYTLIIKSIDTMKYSRDLARKKINDPSFDQIIDGQMKLIKETGATHVAIGTPYDEEFIPIMTRWVTAAREQGLSVWFRGNFSGWEEWYEYKKITPEEHKKLLSEFLIKNNSLFQNGDVFSPCPECENGGPGDPRHTKDYEGFRNFLIEEKNISQKIFDSQQKNILILTSMNYDIANEIILPQTVKDLGGIILIDHYVKTPENFASDINYIEKKLHANIGIGEFGAPIPSIHGTMDREQQNIFIESILEFLFLRKTDILIVNYWGLMDGSTALITPQGSLTPAYITLKNYYSRILN